MDRLLIPSIRDSARSRNPGRMQKVKRSVQQGDGGSSGVVLPLELVGDGAYVAVYTVPVLVGANQQNFSLQVDTGSSDLWIASTLCTSTDCSQTNGHTYDPSSGISTGLNVNITYLEGQVSGPIVWDDLQIGGYSIQNQALAAATLVSSEPLAPAFDGILGLALPKNSIIAGLIKPVTGNAPDGAAFPSNLFGITPSSDAPLSRFYSLSLSRPGSNRVPSYLGLGRHPSDIVTDPSQIIYSPLVDSAIGAVFWRTAVKAITVYVNSVPMPVQLGPSLSGGEFPDAVLDSGVSVIVTTSAIANGIYGAIGISPSADGQYYLPCSMPINMTITLDGQPEIALHPLDLSTEPPSQSSSSNCVGLIQTADSALQSSQVADMILGVSFLRSTYTVMAYEVPQADGSIGNTTAGTDDSNQIVPRLGLLGLTNASIALQEFNTVRVLNEPLPQVGPNGTTIQMQPLSSSHVKGLSTGLIILISLLTILGFCAALFGLYWFVMKRRIRRDESRGGGMGVDGEGDFAYRVAHGQHSQSMSDAPSEDTLRTMRYEELKRKGLVSTVDGMWVEKPDAESDIPSEYKEEVLSNDVQQPEMTGSDEEGAPLHWRDSIFGGGTDLVAFPYPAEAGVGLECEQVAQEHQRRMSELGNDGLAVAMPLLVHTRDNSFDGYADERELVAPGGFAGVGTSQRRKIVESNRRHSSTGSIESTDSVSRMRPIRSPPSSRPYRPPSICDNIEETSAEARNGHDPLA